jgi:hypothetical protein
MEKVLIKKRTASFASAGRMVRANPQLKPQGREAQSLPPGIEQMRDLPIDFDCCTQNRREQTNGTLANTQLYG